MADVGQARSKYVDAVTASRMVDGLLSARTIREMATAGLIPGARRAKHRIWLPRREVAGLITDLTTPGAHVNETPATTERPLVWRDRRGRTTFDSTAAV